MKQQATVHNEKNDYSEMLSPLTQVTQTTSYDTLFLYLKNMSVFRVHIQIHFIKRIVKVNIPLLPLMDKILLLREVSSSNMATRCII